MNKYKAFLKKLEMSLVAAKRYDVFRIADKQYKKNVRKFEKLGFDIEIPDDEFLVKEWRPRRVKRPSKVSTRQGRAVRRKSSS